MRLRLLLCFVPILAAIVVPAPVLAQTNPPSSPSAEVLAGIGVGWRENPWHSLGKSSLRAAVVMAAIRSPARRLLNVEAELGWCRKRPPASAALRTPRK